MKTLENCSGIPTTPSKADLRWIGVAYYPEAWPNLDVAAELRCMKELGINAVRVGEFAWSSLEPEPGHFELGWLQEVIAHAKAQDFLVIVGTPTATPPAWLTRQHPEVCRVNAHGQRVTHGGRRHVCPNSPEYQRQSERITEVLARVLGDTVDAWQIDNELFEDCYCPNCAEAFRSELERRHGSVEQLNAKWNTVLWSQTYGSFEDVPLPNANSVGAIHHPSLVQAYRHFMSESYVEFARAQAQVIRRFSNRPITTNSHYPPAHRIDCERLFEALDFVSTDAYEKPGHLQRFAFEADWMRPLKSTPFWMMETESTHSGSLSPAFDSWANHPGALRAKLWTLFGLGAAGVAFWHWRAHWAGQEMEHGAVLHAWGKPTLTAGEISQVAAELTAHGEFLAGTRPVPARVALHCSYPSAWAFEFGPIARGFDYFESLWRLHGLLFRSNVARDVIFPEYPVAGYDVVLSPYLCVMEETLWERMLDFVEAGGEWVVGPLTACRTSEATAHREAFLGRLERATGVRVRHTFEPAPGTRVRMPGGEHACGGWCMVFEPDGDQRVVGTLDSGIAAGLPVIVERAMGRGRIVFVGALLDDLGWRSLLLEESIVSADDGSMEDGVVALRRVTSDGLLAGRVIVEINGHKADVLMPNGAHVVLPPYGVVVSDLRIAPNKL